MPQRTMTFAFAGIMLRWLDTEPIQFFRLEIRATLLITCSICNAYYSYSQKYYVLAMYGFQQTFIASSSGYQAPIRLVHCKESTGRFWVGLATPSRDPSFITYIICVEIGPLSPLPSLDLSSRNLSRGQASLGVA